MEKRDRFYDDLVDYNINFDKRQGYEMWDKIEKLGESAIVLQDNNMTVQLDVTEPMDHLEIKITGTINPAELSEYDGLVKWLCGYVERFKENNKICIESDGQRKEIRR